MAILTLKREKRWADKLRAYKILFDGREVGSIKEGEVWTFSCEPGRHTLQLKIDWCVSPTLEFDVAADSQEIAFECRSNVNSVLSLFAFFRPDNWIALTRKP